MAPRGPRPKPRGQARNRMPLTHGWIDVPNTRFADGPQLPPRRRDGSTWPNGIAEKWAAWSSMPHARLWHEADWGYARDAIELVAAVFAKGAKIGLYTELRYREKVMGTTWSARQDMRIRCTEPASAAPASVSRLDDFRDL
jgi:hypothetical protein